MTRNPHAQCWVPTTTARSEVAAPSEVGDLGAEADVVAWALGQPAEKRLICRQESAGDRVWTELHEPQ